MDESQASLKRRFDFARGMSLSCFVCGVAVALLLLLLLVVMVMMIGDGAVVKTMERYRKPV